MGAIHIVAVGAAPPAGSLDRLAADLAPVFRASCLVGAEALDAAAAYDPTRGQYYATALLRRLARLDPPLETRLLGVTAHDLFVPVLTFVFGEAQLEGRCALVSFHRLREEFYGLPARPDLLGERLLKEAVHELGHTFGLRHCHQWSCVMASTHAVERLDVKGPGFCGSCLAALRRRSSAEESS